mmetsp:Transcript_2917/g.7325  ORF Transcript_2917/g.7325 Transcript_2917/m.7325 type:complete len:272 (-) Transcript_2917:1213-2028(-)
MQPMMAMVTPGRWPVRSEICAVTSCRSKRVRPHEGHETNSVLMERMREPCSRPKEVVRTRVASKSASASGSTRMPLPRPSQSRPPACVPSCSASSAESEGGAWKWWMTGLSMPCLAKTVKTRRDAWMRERLGGGSSSRKACSMLLSATSSSSDSSPRTVITRRAAPSGSGAAASARSTSATAPSMGAAARAAAGTMTCTATSARRLSVWRALASSSAGGSRSSSESLVEMSLKGRPTTVLQPRSEYSCWSFCRSATVTVEMTEPSRLSRPR